MNWDVCVRELGGALSRYIGLTYRCRLDLIELVVADVFGDKPFLYARELRRAIELHNIKPSGAPHYIQYSVVFGWLFRAVRGGTEAHPRVADRLESTSHIALTALGRALRAALKWERGYFPRFLWEYALLERDFDMYGLMLKVASQSGEGICRKEFWKTFYDINSQKIEWVEKKFRHKSHIADIENHIQWVVSERGKIHAPSPDKNFRFADKTLTEHFNQRMAWAKHLGHFDKSGVITDTGRQLSAKLPSVDDEPFFWLGPSKECAQARIISAADIPEEQYSPAWNLLRPPCSKKVEISDELVEKTANYMTGAFDCIRLHEVAQASLDAVVPYVYFLEQNLGGRVDERELFRKVLDNYRGRIVGTVQPKFSQSHYRLVG